MKKIFFILLIIFSFFSYAQAPPPAVSMPKGNQIALIEEFIKVSNYEESLKKFGMNYMYSKMFKYQDSKNVRILTKEQAELILRDFDFKSFKENSIYNAFSFVSEENLKALTQFYKSLNGKIDKSGGLFINNNVIITNFTGYLNKEIEKTQTNTK